MLTELPDTQYTRSGGLEVAFQVYGEGDLELIGVGGPASHVEVVWEDAAAAHYLERIGSFARVAIFDRRGTGLSDEAQPPLTLETHAEDLEAVIGAAGFTRPALLGEGDAGRLCAMFAATRPERVSALIVIGTSASGQAVMSAARKEILLDVVRIEHGDLEAHVPVDDGSEVGLLQSGFNQMAVGLQERERLRDLFGRHVGTEVARDALDRPVALGGERREVAVLFVDLVGSTELATRWSPEDVVGLLNRFFTIVVETVEREGGWVNKFEGDAALCIFGAPLPDEGCAPSALAAARALRSRIGAELPEADVGVGVSAGLAVAGNVGAEHRFEYTVIGDPVNEAARLCELAKRRPERVVVSEAAVARAGEEESGRWEAREAILLRGRAEPTQLAVPSGEPWSARSGQRPTAA